MRKSLSISLRVVLAAVAAFAAPRYAAAHHEDEPKKQVIEPAAAKFPRGLILPVVEGPKPWSDKPVLNDPDRFQIAIMTDNTGGHRPGIWMKAVERLNWLRPEFVMSVGDLIEGYSEDRNQIESEWREFLGFIDKMQMKFFFVAGNHDLTNPLMHKIWREHFGPKWYSFDYKGVHFVCLSSEEPETKLGAEQLAWLEKDLTASASARWTLLFMHKPLWAESEREIAAGNRDNTDWKAAEKLLGSRPHTVFAGHIHHYAQFDRNGMKYYQLATTGGASPMRGIPYGEFDHVAWLTMESDGPHLANLLLDGILPHNVVTEKGLARFRTFLARSRVDIAPILIGQANGFSEGRIDLRLTNGFDKKVQMTGRIAGLPLRGLTLSAESLSLSAEPGKTTELAVGVRFAEPIAFEQLAQTVFTARFKTEGEDPPLSAEVSLPVVIDRRYDLPKRTSPVVVDGRLDEWSPLANATGATPVVTEATGPVDGRVSFSAAYSDKFVYLAAHVADADFSPEGDALELLLDARPIGVRKSDPRLIAGTYTFRVTPPTADGICAVEARGAGKTKVWPGTTARGARTADGYDVELAVPIEFVTTHQGADWHSVQMTPVVYDQTAAGQKPARVVWRGTPDFTRANVFWGQFVRGQ